MGQDRNPAHYLVQPFILPDGREVSVIPMTFNKARIVVGPPGSPFLDDGWCYASVDHAKAALLGWDPLKDREPSGWFRNPKTGRRRPDGDPAKEYVEP